MSYTLSSMIKKKDYGLVYKSTAISLSILVVGYIIYTFSRQAIIGKKLAYLTQGSPFPVVLSPSPRPSPKYTVPKGTESWNVYEHIHQRFTVRYPEDMQPGIPTDNYIGFYKESNSRSQDIVFSVGKVDENFDISSSILSLEDRQKVLRDLFDTKSNFVKRYREEETHYVQITKKNSLTISGYPAVFYNEAYITWSRQEPSSYQSRILIKTGDSYYTITQGYTSNKDELDLFQNALELTAKSFTLF